MKTFLQSAIDADELYMTRYSSKVCSDEQYYILQRDYQGTEEAKFDTVEHNVYFLLMIAADLGQL